MDVRFIENGTLFDIVYLSDLPGLEIKLKGALYEIVRSTVLHVEGVDLYDFCLDKPIGFRFSIIFFKGTKEYSFFGRFERVIIRGNTKITEISAASGVEEKNRRTMPRLEVSVPVKLYVETSDNTKKKICEGQTVDISFDAICFLSNEMIDVSDRSKFYVEFTLYRYDKFFLPARLVRKGSAPQTVQYKYDYAFVFDFLDNHAEKNRMLMTFFQSRLDSKNM